MKLTIKGGVTRIGDIQTAGNSAIRTVVISKKYHDPETGELKSEDHYPVQIWEDKWAEFKQAYDQSSYMEVEGYLNGRKKEKDGQVGYFFNFKGRNFKPLIKQVAREGSGEVETPASA